MVKKRVVCKTDFKVVPSMFERRKFCSQFCMAADYRTRTGEKSLKLKEKIEKECVFCRNKFAVSPSLTSRQFCSKKCVDSHKSNGVTATCQKCGKVFGISPSRKETATFCSRECQKVEAIEKICPTCKIVFSVLPAFKVRIYCSFECFYQNENYQKAMTENSRTPEARKLNSERAKKYFAANPEKHILRIMAQKGYETSIEKKMRLALESKQISFEKQFKIDRFWVDFAVISSRLVIEADGEFWHQDKEKDAKRDEIIESYGWKVVRFPGKKIVKSVDCCLAEIEEIISSRQ